MSRHPFSLVAGLVRAPIYHCNACRHQYHDWRGVESDTHQRRVVPDAPSSPAEKDAAARERMSSPTAVDHEILDLPITPPPPVDSASGVSTADRSIAPA